MTELASSVWPMVGFALATSASPGPVNIIAAMTGAQAGALASFQFVLGATLAFVLMLALVGSGLGVFIPSSALLNQILATIGAAYILFLAWKIACSDNVRTHTHSTVSSKIPNLLDGIVVQALNPKAWIVALSAISIYVLTANSYLLNLTVLCLIYFFVCLPSLWAWGLLGSRLGLLTGNSRRYFNIAMAVLLVLSVVVFLIDFWF